MDALALLLNPRSPLPTTVGHGAACRCFYSRAPCPPAPRAVCMDARVQCVFLPCGHACACRECARRMRRCPVCRVVVERRQKLFVVYGL